MLKTALFALLATISGAVAGYCSQPVAIPVTWTFTPTVVSQYLFRGVKVGGPSFQPSLELSRGSLLAGIWGSVPLDDAVPGASDPEVDFYATYTLRLSDAADVAVTAMAYTYPNADRSAGLYRSSFEPSVALNYTVHGLRLTPRLYYDFTLEGPTAEIAAFYALPLQRLGTELDFTGSAGTYLWRDSAYRAAPAMKNWGDYWSVGVALPFQVTAHGKIIAGVTYMKGTGNYTKEGSLPRTPNPAAVGRGAVSISYSMTF